MRFMIIRKADAESEAGTPPRDDLLEAMAEYNEALIEAGVMRAGNGLKPSSHAARVKFSKGKPTVTDGPFTEAKELIAGYTIIEVPTRDDALEWARRWPTADGHGEVELEIRPIYELEDFAYGPALDRHARIFERIGER